MTQLRSVIRGFNIVELMVAMTIGLIVLTAVSTVFVSSKANYVTQDSMARLQESARVAMSFITRDLRLAGYYGCASNNSTEFYNGLIGGGGGTLFSFTLPIEGSEANSGTWYPSNVATTFPASGTGKKVLGTDAISMRFTDSALNIPLIADMLSPPAPIVVASSSAANIKIGDIILVTGCGGADLVEVSGVLNGSISHAAGIPVDQNGNAKPPGNIAGNLNRTYSAASGQIMKFRTMVYYVGTGVSGQPTLFRQVNGGTPEEIVEGIEDLQVTYGIAAADRTPRSYLDANHANLGADATKWANVVSAQISLRSKAVGEGGANAQVTPKTFTSTVLLRNLQ